MSSQRGPPAAPTTSTRTLINISPFPFSSLKNASTLSKTFALVLCNLNEGLESMEKRGGKTTASRVPNHCDTSSAALTCDRTAENPEKKPLQAEEKKEGKSGRWRWWTSERPAAAPKKKKTSPPPFPQWRPHNGAPANSPAPLLKNPSPLFIFM